MSEDIGFFTSISADFIKILDKLSSLNFDKTVTYQYNEIENFIEHEEVNVLYLIDNEETGKFCCNLSIT